MNTRASGRRNAPPERCEIGFPLVPTESIRSFLRPNDQESGDLIRNRAFGIPRYVIPHHYTEPRSAS